MGEFLLPKQPKHPPPAQNKASMVPLSTTTSKLFSRKVWQLSNHRWPARIDIWKSPMSKPNPSSYLAIWLCPLTGEENDSTGYCMICMSTLKKGTSHRGVIESYGVPGHEVMFKIPSGRVIPSSNMFQYFSYPPRNSAFVPGLFISVLYIYIYQRYSFHRFFHSTLNK